MISVAVGNTINLLIGQVLITCFLQSSLLVVLLLAHVHHQTHRSTSRTYIKVVLCLCVLVCCLRHAAKARLDQSRPFKFKIRCRRFLFFYVLAFVGRVVVRAVAVCVLRVVAALLFLSVPVYTLCNCVWSAVCCRILCAVLRWLYFVACSGAVLLWFLFTMRALVTECCLSHCA